MTATNGLLFGQQAGGTGDSLSGALALFFLVMIVALIVLWFILHQETKRRRNRQ